MNLPQIRPFEPKDYLSIDSSPERWFHGLPLESDALIHASGPSITGEIDGKIMFCAGIDDLWDGVGNIWLILADDARLHPGVFWALRRILNSRMKDYRRLSCVVKASWKEAKKFAEWFEFKKEATMKKYGPNGEAYCLYARVR